MSKINPRAGFFVDRGDAGYTYDLDAHVMRAFEGMAIGVALTVPEIVKGGQHKEVIESLYVTYSTMHVVIQAVAEGRRKIAGLVGNYDGSGRLIAYRSITSLNDPRVECCGRDAADCDCPPSGNRPTFDRLKTAISMGDNDTAKAILMSGNVGLAREINSAMGWSGEPTPFSVGDAVRQANAKLPAETVGLVKEVNGDRVRVVWPGKRYAPTVGSADDFVAVELHPLAKMYLDTLDILDPAKAENIEEMAREVAISMITEGGFDSQDSDMAGDAMGDTVQTLLMIAFMRQPEMGEVIEGMISEARSDEDKTERYVVDDKTGEGLVSGKAYRVRYNLPMLKRDREAVMVFLEEVHGELMFDARPEAGTQMLPKSWIKEFTVVPDSTKRYVGKIVG